jgi:hypothetical protein
VPAPALPHARQDTPGHVDETEEVSLEHGTDFIVLALLDRGHVTEASIVHQDINFAESRFGLLHGLGDLRRIRDVQLESKPTAICSGR